MLFLYKLKRSSNKTHTFAMTMNVPYRCCEWWL